MKSLKEVRELAQVLEGVYVLTCIPDSPSHRAGMRYGDIILSVNGVRTRTTDDYLAATQHHDGTLRVELFRDGALMNLDLAMDSAPTQARPRGEMV